MNELVSTSVLLFLVLDPFGNAPVFQAVLRHIPPERRHRLLVRELLIAYALLVLVLVAGRRIMDLLGLGAPALGITGGLLLFLVALGMMFPAKSVLQSELDEDPFIVPLAVPLIAGPSAIALLLLLSARHPGFHLPSLAAVTLAWAASAAILLVSPKLLEFLGRKGARALERLAGLILVMIAVQMFLDGIEAWHASLP